MFDHSNGASSSQLQRHGTYWRLGIPVWAGFAIATALIALAFSDGIRELFELWGKKEEYSHAYLVPVISIFLAWQKKDELAQLEWDGSWFGVLLVAIGISLFFVGSLSTIYVVIHYALIITIAGAVLAFTGNRSLRYLWVPLFFLIFMVPLPVFLYQAISTKLQLISSELGVAIIRAFGISVFLEGNVIDLGSYKLQVVEACNGLRYLFPLASFGFLCAYLYRGPFWHRILIFASTIPITVFMNSFRIGLIGITVDNYGHEMAEGVLHDFEGWVIFMACLAVLFSEIWLFSQLQRPRLSFTDAFFVEIPALRGNTGAARTKRIPVQFIAALSILLVGVLLSLSIVKREEVVPARAEFSAFPLEIDGWIGQPDVLERIYLDILKLKDYLFVNYTHSDSGALINFYVAYYDSQRAGESAHSPRSCIPGGGWKIEDIRQTSLRADQGARQEHEANRVQIAMGENRQLVYYWFQQRGRIITNEYLVKWYLFWDALTRNRSDGALVRLTTPVFPHEKWSDGDKRLNQFSRALGDKLSAYVPN